MRFTLCAIGTWGDVAPFMTLGRVLRQRGAEVAFAAPPEFATAVVDAGLNFHPIAPTCTPLVKEVSTMTGSPLSALGLLVRATKVITQEALTELPAIAEGSHMLVATGIAYAAPHVAEALGIPYRAVCVCPRWYPSRSHPPTADAAVRRPKPVNSAAWWINDWSTDRMLDEVVNPWRSGQSLSRVTGLYGRMIGLSGERFLAADEALAPLPDDIEGTRRVSAMPSFQPDSLPRQVEDFLASGEPPVYIGFGSMQPKDAGRLLDLVLESASALNVRTIIPQIWVQAASRSTPGACLAVGHVAFSQLFPRLAAVVHHGGAGTTTTAARSGVPQLVIPHVMDQYYWGHRVHELGIGPRPLASNRLSARRLSAKLRETLDSTVIAEKARSVAGQLAGRDGATELAKALCRDLS